MDVFRDRNVRWILTSLVGLGICAAPAAFWGEALRAYFLKLDDFVYLSQSRTVSSLLMNLIVPHNFHVVPFFRTETYLLSGVGGTLRQLPAVLGMACYLTLLLAMLAAGHLVAWESGRPAMGLAAMAAVGFSTVLGPAVLWFAAGQALMSGTLVLLMLIALQAWQARGGWPYLLLGAMAALAAPLCWSGGYAAGPAALAYLWHGGNNSARLAGTIILGISLSTASSSGLALCPRSARRERQGMVRLLCCDEFPPG